MTHRNAPLTVLGRQRAVAQVLERGRPIAHVAQEFHIARSTLSKWVARYRKHGQTGLVDRSSAPAHRPTRLPAQVVELIEDWRREKKWSARRIARELADGHGFRCCVRTVTRWLDRLGLNRIRDITPDGKDLRRPGKIIARYPGHMVHMDVKKVGKIPDGGGWRVHGRGSEQALAGKRAHKQKVGYAYLHSMIDGFSRLAYTEVLPDEKAATTTGFFHRARVFFAAHGISRITRLVTDNGSNYRAASFAQSTRAFVSRHQRTRPYTPRHNGKVERYQRILTDECLYARDYASEKERVEALGVWNHHYNYHRPHTACGDQPPASRLHTGVDNVMTNYS
ncbi:IS481 family transposase [Propionibacterium freudenreichii]|jgi:transposase InsO family protein|uniref:IS481 family transposase n=2 Tax=Propionibacterium freudenreichii TaxID=1744 RepID=UPI000BC2E1C3|nr:IS481 family transposase [Propionibacterium freudenreichii]MDK9660563.1 IS481 family transposase [Propionibacterium freudenreichii]WGU89667.1 IS481 family transposase [Propionibacterium freudenreichii]WGU90016.1 IS481 family transposase [Propionibacterium freudenreichii]SCQ63424.1 Putative insertion element ISCmi2 transposase [Propionibacterium freudenreichii]SCQ69986.1 Putative insertion element ISCmi2 transposase [Propionibacterium freudenreichii]